MNQPGAHRPVEGANITDDFLGVGNRAICIQHDITDIAFSLIVLPGNVNVTGSEFMLLLSRRDTSEDNRFDCAAEIIVFITNIVVSAALLEISLET